MSEDDIIPAADDELHPLEDAEDLEDDLVIDPDLKKKKDLIDEETESVDDLAEEEDEVDDEPFDDVEKY